jgi:hypothetical protein
MADEGGRADLPGHAARTQIAARGVPGSGFWGYFAHVSEIRPLHEVLGLQTVVLAGVEPAISADDESYNQLQASQRDLWLDLLFEVSADETTVGASRHLLYIGRRVLALLRIDDAY